jgi:hypothetical protein
MPIRSSPCCAMLHEIPGLIAPGSVFAAIGQLRGSSSTWSWVTIVRGHRPSTDARTAARPTNTVAPASASVPVATRPFNMSGTTSDDMDASLPSLDGSDCRIRQLGIRQLGFFVPKPSCDTAYQRRSARGLRQTVRACPLTSIIGRGDCHSLRHSVVVCTRTDVAPARSVYVLRGGLEPSTAVQAVTPALLARLLAPHVSGVVQDRC